MRYNDVSMKIYKKGRKEVLMYCLLPNQMCAKICLYNANLSLT